jgi:two-component system NtrC family sensor kinase
VLAEMIVRGASKEELLERYTGHAQPSTLVHGAFEARDFFPTFGDGGQWLHFMAAPLHDMRGKVVGAIETLVDLSAKAPEES